MYFILINHLESIQHICGKYPLLSFGVINKFNNLVAEVFIIII